MTKHEAFRRQATSDLRLLDLLFGQSTDTVADCHRLHYLQMAAEKAGKAVVFALGGQLPDEGYCHTFVGPLLNVLKRRTIGNALGWDRYKSYVAWLNSLRPFLTDVEMLHPRSGRDPNVEYPWLARGGTGEAVWHVPAECRFGVDPRSRQCQNLVVFIRQIVEHLDALAKLCPGRRADGAP